MARYPLVVLDVAWVSIIYHPRPVSIPTRPPAEKSVHAADEATLNRIFRIISQQVNHLELITGYEGNAFASTANAAEDLLSITSVHPMREEAVRELLAESGTG